MTTSHACPRCDAPLPADAPDGLCPRCLLLAGVDSNVATHREGAPAIPAPTAGTRMRYLGDYELLEEIARGGMGVVYKARQVTLNRVVALKMILAGQLASEAEVQRFLVEAEAAANLQHPHIVAIHEVGRHGEQHYFSMDYVEGRDLASIVAEEPLGAGKATDYLETIARAIHYAHEQGTLHRDLKPQNILIDADDRPRITDFGLAKRLDDDSALTASGSIMGSPSYMPPEQAMGRQDLIGPASDVYSLGAVLYQLMTGHAPFAGKTLAETLQQVTNEPPVPPTRRNPTMPKDLETICLKCLEKAPEQRYASALELAEDLARFRDHQPILARPAGRVRRLIGWSTRRPWAVCAMLTMVLLAACSLAYGLWEQTRFLRHIAENPNFVADPEPSAYLKSMRLNSAMAFVVLILATFDSLLRSRGIRLRDVTRPEQLNLQKPIIPLSRPAVWCYGLLGLAGMIFALLALGASISGYVWHGRLPFGDFFSVIFPTAFFSLLLIATAVHEQRAQTFGVERLQQEIVVPPTPEQLAATWLLDQPKLYRWTAATFAAVAVVCLAVPEIHRMPIALATWCGWCFGAGIPASMRFSGMGRRYLAVLPFMVPPLMIRFELEDKINNDWTSAVFFIGIALGTYVIYSAQQDRMLALTKKNTEAAA